MTDGVVTLRPWREEDADAVYEACQDPELQRWIPLIPRPYTREDALAFVRGELELGPYSYAVEVDGVAVGRSG